MPLTVMDGSGVERDLLAVGRKNYTWRGSGLVLMVLQPKRALAIVGGICIQSMSFTIFAIQGNSVRNGILLLPSVYFC